MAYGPGATSAHNQTKATVAIIADERERGGKRRLARGARRAALDNGRARLRDAVPAHEVVGASEPETRSGNTLRTQETHDRKRREGAFGAGIRIRPDSDARAESAHPCSQRLARTRQDGQSAPSRVSRVEMSKLDCAHSDVLGSARAARTCVEKGNGLRCRDNRSTPSPSDVARAETPQNTRSTLARLPP